MELATVDIEQRNFLGHWLFPHSKSVYMWSAVKVLSSLLVPRKVYLLHSGLGSWTFDSDLDWLLLYPFSPYTNRRMSSAFYIIFVGALYKLVGSIGEKTI